MGRFEKKDPKLSEVKAVLQRLQGLPGEPPSAGPRTTRPWPPRRKAGVVTAALVFVSAGVLGAAYLLGGRRGPEKAVAPHAFDGPRRMEPGTSPTVKAVLEATRGLMSKGQVRAARAQLLALAEQGSPDAAWDLARSYDPNVLAALPAADAAPDIEKATRWYRVWYAAAVREGLIADSVSLERIIGSMRR